AQQARERGLTVVAITSREHSLAGRSRHPEGLRLLDVADIVLDTHAPEGDITLTLEDGTQTGPTSTILAGLLLHSLAIGAMEQLSRAGVRPPVLQSMNRAGGDDSNETVLAPSPGGISGNRDRSLSLPGGQELVGLRAPGLHGRLPLRLYTHDRPDHSHATAPGDRLT